MGLLCCLGTGKESWRDTGYRLAERAVGEPGKSRCACWCAEHHGEVVSQPAALEGCVPVMSPLMSAGLLDRGASPGWHKLLCFVPLCLSAVNLFHPFWEQFRPYSSSRF